MKSESGNVLFFILIGIVLFGALSYTVSDTGTTGGNTDREEMRSAIGELYNYAASLEKAVQKMRLMNGCEENDIDFYSPGVNSSNYEHATENPRCKVFHPQGGGMTYAETPTAIFTTTSSDQYRFSGQQVVSGMGSSNAELIFGARVSQLACIEINNDLGIANPSDLPPVDNDIAGNIALSFNGGQTANGSYANSLTLNVSELNGRKSGCVHDQNDSYYFYYHVLLAR